MSFLRLGLLLGAVGALASVLLPAHTEMSVGRRVLRADGRATLIVKVEQRNLYGGLTVWPSTAQVQLSGHEALDLSIQRAHEGTLVIRAGHHPGTFRLEHPEAAPLTIALHADPRDRDDDGLPDAAELLSEEDRAAFVRWFTTLAEAQAQQIDDGWPAIHQDCAGLVRFAYKEALKTHGPQWLQKRRYLPTIGHPDVRSLEYPHLPFMGDLAFSKTGNTFDAARPRTEQFTAAASARTLWQGNTAFISRRMEDARAGDLIFYRVPYGSGSRMHTMIVLGARSGADHQAPGQRVVYHTGGNANDGGEIRLVDLRTLAAHPDPDWHPRADNPRFLGVHRLNLIEHSLTKRPNPWATASIFSNGDPR